MMPMLSQRMVSQLLCINIKPTQPGSTLDWISSLSQKKLITIIELFALHNHYFLKIESKAYFNIYNNNYNKKRSSVIFLLQVR